MRSTESARIVRQTRGAGKLINDEVQELVEFLAAQQERLHLLGQIREVNGSEGIDGSLVQ
jgi:hypothetical protein